MNITGISQQSQNKKVAFGMNFKFTNDFYKTGATKPLEQQLEIMDVFQKLANDETLLKDERKVEVSPDKIVVFDNHLGNISYKINLNQNSITKTVNRAYEDKAKVMTLNDYVKELSQSLGFNITFSTDGLFGVVKENPFEKSKLAIDTIAKRVNQFSDKEDISMKIYKDFGNSFEMRMDRKEASSYDGILTNGNVDPEDIEKRTENLYRETYINLGDKVPAIEAKKAKERILVATLARENALDSFTSMFNNALNIEG